jgi:hypothetical protein
MSFFDEDDEPVRTTSRPRARPRPRRASPAGGGPSDPQALLVRRVVAGAVLLVVVILLGLVVKSCRSSQHENALKEYNRQVTGIATQSAETGTSFFGLLNKAGNQQSQELQGSILSLKVQADKALDQARALSVPSDMVPAQQSLEIALELRRDALAKIAANIRTALGDQGDAADRAINQMAAQMQAFSASDVLYAARVIPFIKDRLASAEIGGQTIGTSQFLPDISWLSPQFVAQKLDQQLSSGGAAAGSKTAQPTGPGLHGTGLNSTSYGNVTLQPGVANHLTYVPGQAFAVTFTNQGENDEFNIKVQLRLERQGGSPITLNGSVAKLVRGAKTTVQLPLNRTPAFGASVIVHVTVAAVPGEKKKDNNTAQYPSLFSRG